VLVLRLFLRRCAMRRCAMCAPWHLQTSFGPTSCAGPPSARGWCKMQHHSSPWPCLAFTVASSAAALVRRQCRKSRQNVASPKKAFRFGWWSDGTVFQSDAAQLRNAAGPAVLRRRASRPFAPCGSLPYEPALRPHSPAAPTSGCPGCRRRPRRAATTMWRQCTFVPAVRAVL